MIKKICLAIVFGGMLALPASAQDVLNEIVKTSLATVNDTTKSMEDRKLAIFKYDAMTYLRSKLLQPADVLKNKNNLTAINQTIRILNEQALAMNEYITLYIKRLSEAKKKNQDIVTNLFKQATRDHKYFNDPDTEVTLAYYDRSDYPIQFCLDCDWVKTLAFIRTIDWSNI